MRPVAKLRSFIPDAAVLVLLALMLASASAVMLVLIRVVLTAQPKFGFLVWNLFLAWIPLLLAIVLHCRHEAGKKRSWAFALAGLGWLFFLPNAPYIVTDLIHLRPRPPIPIWVDMIIIVKFALIGLVLGFLALYLVQHIVSARCGWRVGWVFALTVLALTGVGIYLGRFLRWNSWDLVINPLGLAHDVLHQFRHPRSNPAPYLYTMLFAQVGIVSYTLLYAITHLAGGKSRSPTPALQSQI